MSKPSVGPAGTTAGAEISECSAVPRSVPFIVVKRIDPRLPNTWGHWWIEVDDKESYGWWPNPCPMGWRGALLGSRGCLNGIGTPNGGTPTRDAYHGDEPDHWFHPTLILAKSDDQLRADIRAFAHCYVGGFRWQWWWLREPGQNCRTFQQEMFDSVGLYEEPEYLYTQGPGCPFMFQFRRVKWYAWDLLNAALDWIRVRRRGRTKPARDGCANADAPTSAAEPATPMRLAAPSNLSRPGGAALAALRLSRGRRAGSTREASR